jgi:ATP-dependent Lon protease
LNGEVLPIGGLKEKTLAAHRAKIKTILIPEHNSKNLDEIPDEVKNETDIRMCKEISEIIKYAIPNLHVTHSTLN